MAHPTLDRLRAFTAAEAAPSERARLAEHVLGCERCRATTHWIGAVRAGAESVTGVQADASAWDRIERRVAAGEVVLLPVAPARPVGGARPGWLRAAAAAIAVFVAAAGVAAIPGTPWNEWIRERIGADAPAAAGRSAAPPYDAASAVNELAVPLLAGALDVAIESPGAGLMLRVRLADEDEVGVRATGGAAGAQYRAGTGRLVIEDAAGGEIALTIPRSARLVRVSVDGAPWIEHRAGRLIVLAPEADTVGSDILLAVPAGRRPGS